jgi:hypothetical protein
VALRILTRLAVGVAAFCAGMAPCSFARVGSVISSFSLPNEFHSAIFRGRDYVYAVYYRYNAPLICINKYTLSGSWAGVVCYLNRGGYPDADHSALGDGYFSLIASGPKDFVHDRETGGGSIVGSWCPGADIRGFAYIPGARYKYVTDGWCVWRFTVSGSLVSSFYTNCVSLAATDVFRGKSGEYVIAAGHKVVTVYSSAGSLKRTFAVPPYMTNSGAVCGPGYPDDCGTTLWCIYDRYPQPYNEPYVYQISLGNGVAVAPMSVGKVKALFR